MFQRTSIISAQTSRTDVYADTLEQPVLEERILAIRGLFAAFELSSGTVHTRKGPRRIVMVQELEKYVEK